MQRDPVIDVLRGVAVLGVITGHWLVTALVTGPNGLVVDSPLRWLPGFTPLSWVLQTLGLFFFAGGFAAARSRSGWWRKVRRLAVPVAVVVACWALVLAGFVLRGMPQETISTIIHLVVTPLWFLGVYVALLALMPIVRWLDARLGAWAVLLLVLLAVVAEFSAFSEVNVLVAWWAPWQAGVVVARVGFVRSWGLPLLVTGIAAYVLLVRFAGYPASAVGGTGEPRSNLSPPSPAALALAAAQIGVVLLAAPLVQRVRWRAVRWLNEHALALFLLHQSALLTVTLVAEAFGVIPGLHTPPTDPAWPLERLLWFPLFAVALVGWLTALRWIIQRKTVMEVAR
jgi:peptidoglycan/LPS O-acetylase OafA/YrhL